MKKLILIGIGLLLVSITQANFSDTNNHKYEDSIQYLSSNWVVKWYPDGTFWPDNQITRAEIMKIILESYLDQIPESNNCFPDVTNQWYAKYVCYAKENNIVKWYPDGTFWAGKSVTNAEAFKMALETFNANIDDAANTNRWYQWYVDFVHDNNIFSQYDIRPDKPMTRGEMSYLTHQLMLEKNWDISFKWSYQPLLSDGCGKTPPSPAPTESYINWMNRHYITAVGSKYNKDTPTKLVFAFHGRTNDNNQVRWYYKVEEASKWNAIFVYPLALPEEGPSRSWKSNWDPSDQLRDFALFDQLLEEFTDNYCIDLDQVFVVGHSLGAWFTNSLACARGDVIRATASVGWSTTINECSWPVAAMIMHNPEDRLASFAGGETARNQLVTQNSCDPNKTVSVWPADGNCVKYTDCQEHAPVIWCPHSDSTAWNGKYYPHTWPDFAPKEIWNFFLEQD